MIQVVACREQGWMDWKTDYRQWDHLCRAFGACLDLVDTLPGKIKHHGKVVVVDETADQSLHDFVHPENAVYVFGRTGLNQMQGMIEHDYAICIDTTFPICLFGVVAAGMVLYDRKLKRGRHCNQ